MNRKCVVLLSGGLDSTLAACLMREQGIEVAALNFQTMFGCCKDDARQVAYRLGIPYTMLKVGDDYLKVVESPKYGYGRGINPCVDCRIYMFRVAKNFMDQMEASFLVSGEVVNQRPMSQKKTDFRLIERDTELDGLILRPLSAKLLSLTKPEREGVVDRSRLYGIQGRSREQLLELAVRFQIDNPPHPSAGCALTSPQFAKKVRDIFDHQASYERWEFEILKIGRHFRLDKQVRVIVARNDNQNEHFHLKHPKGTRLLSCKDFAGPNALVIGSPEEHHLIEASGLVLRYSQKPLPRTAEIEISDGCSTRSIFVSQPMTEAEIDKVRIVV